jgi:hypothetical protein
MGARPLAITSATVYERTSIIPRLGDAVIVIEGERLFCIGNRSKHSGQLRMSSAEAS